MLNSDRKLCIDCKHFIVGYKDLPQLCSHPRSVHSISMIDGTIVFFLAENFRTNACGTHAAYFEPLENKKHCSDCKYSDTHAWNRPYPEYSKCGKTGKSLQDSVEKLNIKTCWPNRRFFEKRNETTTNV